MIAFYCKTILLSTIVSTCARLEMRYIMGISKRKIIIGKKKSSTMHTFSYFRKMASISPFFLCSSKRLSKWSSLTFGFAWLNFQGPNKPFKHKLKFPSEPWGQTLLIRCNWFSFLHFNANSVEKYIAKFEKYDSFYLFLQISKYQLFFPIEIWLDLRILQTENIQFQ